MSSLTSPDNYQQLRVSSLNCYGCAHSAAGTEPPGEPSGERPCYFSIRNKDRDVWQRQHLLANGHELKEWYDGSPTINYPMDCYYTIDMGKQMTKWEDEDDVGIQNYLRMVDRTRFEERSL